MGLKENHYPNDIKTKDPPRWQVAAHHAYFGGRIEMMKQGYLVKGELHIYDVASAYPSAMVELPSMWDGKWQHKTALSPSKALTEIRAQLESANILSMYKVKFTFPTYAKERKSRAEIEYFRFFPLPYRTKHGLILFPSTGYGWYMRDDVLAAVAWLEKFISGLPKGKRQDRMTFEIEEAWIFNPGNDAKPYAFIEPLYEQRRILKEIGDDVGQTAIKLPLNSIYGKPAQAVGEDDKPLPSACPIMLPLQPPIAAASLSKPLCSIRVRLYFLRPTGLFRNVSSKGYLALKSPARTESILATGNMRRLESGLFVQAGVYWYGKIVEKDGQHSIKFVSKTRGGDPKKYDKEADVWKWLTDNILPKWEEPFDHRAQITFPKLEKEYQYYITAGSAVASLQRWKVCGRFSKGAKRTQNGEWHNSTSGPVCRPDHNATRIEQ